MRPSHISGLVVLMLALGAMVCLAVWGAWVSWRLPGVARMSVHGWIAMSLAGSLTSLLTGGLIWLAFYSARSGYDDDQTY